MIKDVINLAKQHPDWWSRGRFLGQVAPVVIKTDSRSSVILPDFLNCVFFVHNGTSKRVRVHVSEAMVGHKLGEFAPTRKRPQHKTKTPVIARKK